MKASDVINRIESLSSILGDVSVLIKVSDNIMLKEANNIYRDVYGNIIIE